MHPYPAEILPQKHYKDILSADDLIKNYPVTVNRRGNPAAKYRWKLKDGRDIAVDQTLAEGTVTGLSVNLLGGPFSDAHLIFNTTETGTGKTWDNGEKPVINLDYEVIEPIEPNYFVADQLHGQTLPYKYRLDIPSTSYSSKEGKEKVKKAIYEDLKSKVLANAEKYNLATRSDLVGKYPDKEDIMDVSCRIELAHHPTSMNYWHFQFDLYRLTDETEVKKDTPNHDKINTKFRQRLKLMISDIIPTTYTIDPRFYTNNTTFHL